MTRKQRMASYLALIGIGNLTLMLLLAQPVMAETGDPTFFFVNNGSTTGGMLNLSNSPAVLGPTTSAAMGTTTFTFTSTSSDAGAGTWTKANTGTDNFIIALSGSGIPAAGSLICMDVGFSTTSTGTDSGTSCATSTGSPGAYTFTIPALTSGLVLGSDTVTITIHCTVGGGQTATCSGVTMGWAGSLGSFGDADVQIPSTIPEFGTAAIVPAALALAGLLGFRRFKLGQA